MYVSGFQSMELGLMAGHGVFFKRPQEQFAEIRIKKKLRKHDYNVVIIKCKKVT